MKNPLTTYGRANETTPDWTFSHSVTHARDGGPTRHHFLDFASIAVILAVLLLGLAIVVWEWRTAHNSASTQSHQTPHDHRAQSDPSPITSAEKH